MSAEIQQQELVEPTSIAQVNTAVAEFDRVAAGIGALKERYAGVVFDVATTAGMKAACEARAAIRAPRYEVEKVRKAVKAPLLKLGKDVDARAAQITADLLAIEEPVHLQISTEEARKETERKAKLEAEQRRVAAINADIEQDLRCVPTAMVGRLAADIDRTIRDVVAIEITAERFAEFAQLAAAVKESTLTKLREMHAKQVALEAEQERLRMEREELARQRAAQEEANRLERERIAAEEAAARAKREQEEAEARRKREAEEAAAAAERKRLNDEIEARLKAEREDAERRERERQAQREREDAERRERQRLEDEQRQAAERERQRIEQQRLEREREAAQAEQRRIAEENARQAQELQRQQDAIDAQRAELERQTAALTPIADTVEIVAAADAEPVLTTEALTSLDLYGDKSGSGAAAKEFAPTAEQLIDVVVDYYTVGPDMAAKWLRDAFAPVGAA